MSHLPDPATFSARADQRSAGRTRFVATGSQTRGDFGLFEVTMSPGGGGPGPHLHRTFSESFHVLEGELAVLDGDRWTTARAGDLVYVPRSGVHAFRSAGPDVGARFLILFTPGAPREQYFEQLVELHAGGRTPSTAEIDELALRHDQLNLRD
ncbi:cupin domain-containing protein [Modestobacter sp. I12A-02628]|uniref:Cupin domain-containing protein n=1 Tax=Goekera deserti TaxID=2497753 RepID=A0A7K3WDN1_9ACTN|nr:cupin domain-containing protein [Goekera deserti]MPQ98451.1 cupin domain-containing protein [Goekera deserti]NDI48280.1 cupin domain-containing protein [Goekera deserti]NEL54029.1 cupin domain-containing protein [Goekera deserti]